MTWVFEGESGDHVVVQVLGQINVTSPYHGVVFENAWQLRTTTTSNGTVAVALIQIESGFLRTFSQQVDVFTASGDHLRIVRNFKSPVPIPWWGAMAPGETVRYMTDVRVEQVLNGRALPTSDQEDWRYLAAMQNTTATKEVPAGTFTGWMVGTSSHQGNPFNSTQTWYLYDPSMEFYVGAYKGTPDGPATLRLIEAVLTMRPVLEVETDPAVPYAGQTVTLDASKSRDPDGEIVSYNWGFVDGSHKDGKTITHTWAASGRHPVVLTLTDDEGGVTSQTFWVRVVEPPTELSIVSAYSAHPNRPISFKTLSPERIVRATWDFADGTPGAAGTHVTHAFAEPGSYNVTVRAVDARGQTATAVRTVQIVPQGQPLPTDPKGGQQGGIEADSGSGDGFDPGRPRIISPGNGSLLPSTDVTFIVDIGDLPDAELHIPPATKLKVPGPGMGLVSGRVPLEEGPVTVTLARGEVTFDSVTLIPAARPPTPHPDDHDGSETGSNGIPFVGFAPLLALLAAVAVAIGARRTVR